MKRIAALTLSAALLVLGAVGLSMPASAAGLSQHVQVTGYDPNVDYTAAIQRTLEDGSAYAMQAVSYTHLDVYKRQSAPSPTWT